MDCSHTEERDVLTNVTLYDQIRTRMSAVAHRAVGLRARFYIEVLVNSGLKVKQNKMAEHTQDKISFTFPTPGAQVEAITFHGWQAVRLSNDLIEAVIVPEIGGRIMVFNLGPYAYLWVNPALAGRLFSSEENQGNGTLAAWKNYGGSKTWPAPQGWETENEWHGPPDPVLDTGRYVLDATGQSEEAVYVQVSSPTDPRTGVRITRKLTLRNSGARAALHLEMENTSNIPRCWGIWEVVQLDATRQTPKGESHNDQAWMYTPSNPRSRFTDGYKVMFGAQDNPEWQTDHTHALIAAQYRFQVGKIGVDSQAGWVAFVNQENNFVFCQRFRLFPDENYPDGGATVEFWTTGLGEPVGGLDYTDNPLYHVEAEVVGPLRTMQPGERQKFDIEWCACRCPGPIIAVSQIGCVHQRLLVEERRGILHLNGIYGVFEPGSVRLIWKNPENNELATETIGLAHPLDVLQLNLVRKPPAGWKSVELVLIGAPETKGGFIDRYEVT